MLVQKGSELTMPKKLKAKKSTSNATTTFLTAIAVTLLSALVLSMIFAKVIMMGLIHQSATQVLAIVITAISTFIGCSIVAKSMPEKKLLCGYLLAACYLVLVLILKALFVKGPMDQFLSILLPAAAAATAAGLLQARPKKKRRI